MARPIRKSAGRDCVVGNYVVGKQIGAGSFSTVWHARHLVHGTEVAIKEIDTARLNSKLQESLKSEFFILKRIDHPNIIHLHDMIEEDGKIYIVLEFCKGGDLSMFLQRHQGRIPEATAKHFMQQLAEGLKVLREYSLIHRDLKPQNLLLSSNDDNCILKIADFGFARSLQPRGLAETLCGSPLYMAPEIMQLQKYDAKADLWSVGAILFQLVTGKTPFTGSNQIQLLQNIIKSTELQFPVEVNLGPHCIDLCRKLLRRNPVERLAFEEFFSHPYLSESQPDMNEEEMSQEDYLPFILDSDTSGPVQNPSLSRRPTTKFMHGFSLDLKPDRRRIADLPDSSHIISNRESVPLKTEISKPITGSRQLSEGNLKEAFSFGSLNNRPTVTDSLESIDKDYVFVSGHQMDLSSSGHASKTTHSPAKTDYKSFESGNMNSSTSAPVPIVATTTGRVSYRGNVKGCISPNETSQGPINKMDTSEQPSTDCISKIESLKRCASAITELVNEKICRGKKFEAFSIQFVILALWKRALDTCQTQTASAIEGIPRQEIRRNEEIIQLQPSSDIQNFLVNCPSDESVDGCYLIEKAYINEVQLAEKLSEEVDPAKNVAMPDAMELIYQSALALGRDGAVDEYMGDINKAVVLYSKAVQLFEFLLVEAPFLDLKPPFSLVNSDRCRIQHYIDVINLRRHISQTKKLELLKSVDQLSMLELGDNT